MTAYGLEQVPLSGPLIVASNHVGGVDTLAVASCIPRKDLKIMVSDIGFLHAMSIAEDFFIFVPVDASWPESLHSTKPLNICKPAAPFLVFAHGEVEPDPELMPGASDSIRRVVSQPGSHAAESTCGPLADLHSQRPDPAKPSCAIPS